MVRQDASSRVPSQYSGLAAMEISIYWLGEGRGSLPEKSCVKIWETQTAETLAEDAASDAEADLEI